MSEKVLSAFSLSARFFWILYSEFWILYYFSLELSALSFELLQLEPSTKGETK